jgi:hypothetical protein
MLTSPGAIDAMAQCGCSNPKYRDGYILSKPGHGHALYWHRDWGCWVGGGPADEETVSPMATQMFLMLYLVDTTPHNGCLRVIPGSHLQRISLDNEATTAGVVDMPRQEGTHGGRHWADDLATNPALPEALQRAVAEYPSALDVPVKAGDLVIGDARLYHSAYQNNSDKRRTCITMWWLNWDRCGPAMRSHSSHGPMPTSGPIGPCRVPVLPHAPPLHAPPSHALFPTPCAFYFCAQFHFVDTLRYFRGGHPFTSAVFYNFLGSRTWHDRCSRRRSELDWRLFTWMHRLKDRIRLAGCWATGV